MDSGYFTLWKECIVIVGFHNKKHIGSAAHHSTEQLKELSDGIGSQNEKALW
jgi:ribosomal silencing factor RsfS